MKRLSVIEKMLMISVMFTIFLLGARIIYTGQLTYVFYVWNLFLAIIPVVAGRQLARYESFGFSSVTLLMVWLLFFPNAPYIITDVFHFTERPPVPQWYDLLLVISGAWNGLMLGIVSLLYVEDFLLKRLCGMKVNLIVSGSIVLCAFGIYLGRFLRFNSWDVVTDPRDLMHAIGYRLVYPFQHVGTWAFTFAFSGLLWIIYFTLKNLPGLKWQGSNVS